MLNRRFIITLGLVLALTASVVGAAFAQSDDTTNPLPNAVCRQEREPGDRLSYLTDAFGMTIVELRAYLADGGTIETLAAEKGIDLSRIGGLPEYLADSYVFQAITLQAMGDGEGALATIQEAKSIAKNLSPWYKEIVEPYEAQIRMAQGDLDEASRLVDERDFIRKDEFGLEFYTNKIMQARIQVKRCETCKDELEQVRRLLVDLSDIAESRGANSFFMKILALQSLIAWMMGEREEALQFLRQAILLAKPEGYIRFFVDLGPKMGELLQYALSKGIDRKYTTILLEALDVEPSKKTSLAIAGNRVLAEPLSEREVQVLRLLNSDLSTPDVAKELFIAVSTVRTHIKNIYSKLDVHSRIEAVDRAKEWGLI